MNSDYEMLNTRLPKSGLFYSLKNEEAKQFHNSSIFILQYSFRLATTSLFGYDFVFLLQPIFSACMQNPVRCRREYRIRCLPDRCRPDLPGRSYFQRVLMFLQYAGCRVSHAFTLRLGWRSGACRLGHACRIRIWLFHLRFKICARSDCAMTVYL